MSDSRVHAALDQIAIDARKLVAGGDLLNPQPPIEYASEAGPRLRVPLRELAP